MSQQQQFLDVVIVRRRRGRFAHPLPDGLDRLADHNLISFKSHHEALDSWAMKELIGYYVAYRKLVSPSPSQLLSEDRFRLYAVSARFPHNLSRQVPWQERQAGVYDCQWGTDMVRVIVAGQLPQETRNAPLLFFSASRELIEYAKSVYQPRSEHTSGILRQLLEQYEGEGLLMPYTWADFDLDYINQHLPELTPERQRQVLERLPAERRHELFQSLPAEQQRELLQMLSAERQRELFQMLSAEQRRELFQSLPVEERLAGLSPEQIQQYLEQLTPGRTAKPRKPRRKR
ncbi:MAG TPA: hypothetical protein VMG10_27280 [Gemmataceae bacterium]|nr:hypothetical protein [Gemmataceae bacterium]